MGCYKLTYWDENKGLRKNNMPLKSGVDYYPFGLSFNQQTREGTQAQRYKFNGMEEINDLGLNLNMTLFRPYDPALGRFTGIDLMADFIPSITPYNFGFNNPIFFSDADGLLGDPKRRERRRKERQRRRRKKKTDKENRRKGDKQRKHFHAKHWTETRRTDNWVYPTDPLGAQTRTNVPSTNVNIAKVEISEVPIIRGKIPVKSRVGEISNLGTDVFRRRSVNFADRRATYRDLIKYVGYLNADATRQIEIILGAATGRDPDYLIPDIDTGVEHMARYYLPIRARTIRNAFIKLGLKNPNQVTFPRNKFRYDTKAITIEITK